MVGKEVADKRSKAVCKSSGCNCSESPGCTGRALPDLGAVVGMPCRPGGAEATAALLGVAAPTGPLQDELGQLRAVWSVAKQ